VRGREVVETEKHIRLICGPCTHHVEAVGICMATRPTHAAPHAAWCHNRVRPYDRCHNNVDPQMATATSFTHLPQLPPPHCTTLHLYSTSIFHCHGPPAADLLAHCLAHGWPFRWPREHSAFWTA
jgi:hypothetical protein